MTNQDFNTRLDKILKDFAEAGQIEPLFDEQDYRATKQALKDLFLEVIGGDEPANINGIRPEDNRLVKQKLMLELTRNELRQALRDTITLTIKGE